MEANFIEFIQKMKLKMKYKCGLNDYTYYNSEKKQFANHFEKQLLSKVMNSTKFLLLNVLSEDEKDFCELKKLAENLGSQKKFSIHVDFLFFLSMCIDNRFRKISPT